MSNGINDVIQVDINSDISQAEKCRKALEGIANKAYNLDDALRQGTISYDKYNKEIEKLAAQSAKVNAAFDAATGAIAANSSAAQAAAASNKALTAEEGQAALEAVQAARQAAKDKAESALQAAAAVSAAAQQKAAAEAAADALAKQAAKDAATAARQAAKEKAQADKEAAAAARAAAKDTADAVKKAANDQAQADRQAARDQAQAARQSAKDKIQAARDAAAAAKQSAKDQADAAAQVVAAQKAVDQATQRAAQATSAAASKSGQKVLGLARLFDDLQYVPQQGLRPIINNLIEQNAVLGMAAIGVQTLINNWGTLVGVFSGGAVKTQAEEMEELGKKTKLTTDEFERLARFQAGEKNVKDLRESRPQAEKDADERTLKAIGEAGQQQVVAGLLKSNPEFVKRQSDVAVAQDKVKQREEELRHANEGAGESEDAGAIERAEKNLLEARENLAKVTDSTAEQLVADAKDSRFNKGARERLAKFVQANPDAFGPKGKQLLADLNTIGEGKDPADVKKEKEAADKKADADYDKDLQERTREADQDAQKKSDAYYKRTDEMADPLQKRFNVASARGEEINEASIRSELENAGSSPEDAEKFAKPVLEKLRKGADQDLTKRASEKGVTRERAAGMLIEEDDQEQADEKKKKDDAREKMLTDARQGAEAKEKDRADQLKRLTAGEGMSADTRGAAMRAMLSANPERMFNRMGEQLTKHLVSKGMDPEQAKLAAREHIQGERDKLNDDINEGAMRGPAEPMKAAERIGVADFARSVESAGMDIAKQGLDVNKQQLEVLTEIARKTGRGATF